MSRLEGLRRYCAFLEALSPQTLGELEQHVTPDVRFKDPFNDCRGSAAMRAVLDHMFASLGAVNFTITHRALDGEVGLIAWRFTSRLRGRPWRFDGMSRLSLTADGRIAEHIDHWDSGEEFYRRLPVLGAAIAAIRRRVSRC